MASWKKADLTDLSGAPPAQGRAFAYVTSDGSGAIPRVLWTGQDAHIHEARLEDGSWKRSDLMDQAGGPPNAAGFPFAYVTRPDGNPTPRVIYRATDNHVHELRLDGGAWRRADLAQQAGGMPNAQGNPAACVTDMEGEQVARVVFCGDDKHIHEVRLEGGSWKRADLSEQAGAPNAVGRPSAYASDDHVPRVVYRSGNGHITELRLEGGSWKKADLTDLSGAPPAAGDPVGYATPSGSGSTPRVVYRDGEAHLQELRLA